MNRRRLVAHLKNIQGQRLHVQRFSHSPPHSSFLLFDLRSVVDGCRGVLNAFIPDVFIYTDHFKGAESGKSPGFGISLVAETTDGFIFSAERMADKGTLPEDLGWWRGGADGPWLARMESRAVPRDHISMYLAPHSHFPRASTFQASWGRSFC